MDGIASTATDTDGPSVLLYDAASVAADAAAVNQTELDRLVQECLDREAQETPLVRCRTA